MVAGSRTTWHERERVWLASPGPVRLEPLPVTRVANAALGALVAVTGVFLVVDAALPDLARLAGVLVAAAGVVLAVRGWRLGVMCERGEVAVRGLLRTPTIPRDAVIELTDFPALRWRSTGPLPGWTPIVAFLGSPRVLPRIERHNDEQLRRLRRWLKRRRMMVLTRSAA